MDTSFSLEQIKLMYKLVATRIQLADLIYLYVQVRNELEPDADETNGDSSTASTSQQNQINIEKSNEDEKKI